MGVCKFTVVFLFTVIKYSFIHNKLLPWNVLVFLVKNVLIILDFGGFKVYFAGDTELIPEMSVAKGADIAFLPKNLPYTLSDEKFIEAANMLHPKNLFPIHYFEIDGKKLAAALDPGISMYIDGVNY